MVKVEIKGKEYYYNQRLIDELDRAKHNIKKDWDYMFIVDGIEGAGKSIFAQQIGLYLDPTLTLDRICFTGKELIQALDKANKYQVVIFDEAFGALGSKDAMTEISRTLNHIFAEIRQKNLFMILCLPSFMELNKYPAIHRSRALFHIYTGKNMERGYFGIYPRSLKKDLYIKGKKFLSYPIRPAHTGRFTNYYTVDEKSYRKKKHDSLKEYAKNDIKSKLGKREIKALWSKYAVVQTMKDAKIKYDDIIKYFNNYLPKEQKVTVAGLKRVMTYEPWKDWVKKIKEAGGDSTKVLHTLNMEELQTIEKG